ncbi:neutral zinc metallopeptidase [Yoonia sp. 208BN28-4]|uniref:neutral zinc metallopeptidase n=1 Tax=Yoonia sp. 208BN28-4 TaxID=3126505 RepID=UPI00309C2133
MRWLVLCAAAFTGGAAGAETGDPLIAAARASYDTMPNVQLVAQIAGNCGANADVNDDVAYCTSNNTIYLTRDAAGKPYGFYLIAHGLGHAVQVQHGMADFALSQVRSRPQDEAALRGMVERQVDCLAGFLMARAGMQQGSPAQWFDADPFADAHWGRNPLSVGPVISIDLAARDEWFNVGQRASTPAACAVGELPVAPLMDDYKG